MGSMYDIRQFKPTLYVLVLMGMVGYSLAAESPAFFMFPTILLLLNGWLVKTNRFTPMPRWIANGATLLCLVWAGSQVFGSRATTILVIGQFLVFLQLVKLYEQRANRDYAQLLILSLLLMVAASINTASLLFGIILIAYLFLSLYCCLLFHLKVDTEHARSAMALPDSDRTEITLRQDQRNLSKSMRRLTSLVSSAAVVMAVLVFLFFPRGMGSGMLGLQMPPSQALTGFSDQISFSKIAAITQNQDPVAWVSVWKNDELIRGTQTLYLRGISFDIYNGSEEEGGQWQWQRSRILSMADPASKSNGSSVWKSSRYGPGDTVYKQVIKLKPTGTQALFALAGAYALSSEHDLSIRQCINDEILQSMEPMQGLVTYTVLSRGSLDPTNNRTRAQSMELLQEIRAREEQESGGFDRSAYFGLGRRGRWFRSSQIDPAVAEYVRRPEVTDGLGAQRDPRAEVTDLDERIAAAIEKHLQTKFTYTLDLTDSKRLDNQDPMAWFLSDKGHRGHCEYFAGAMTLMCQSLGLQARVVAGFKCDEYNNIGGFYQVRQSHAHAWVEVLTKHGWVTFDPTSGREGPPPSAVASMWQKVKHAFNFLEFSWQQNVVAYDNDNRENLVANLNQKLTNTAIHGSGAFERLREWMQAGGDMIVSSQILAGFMGLMVIVLVVAVVIFVFEKLRLRRRAARIGLDSLPASDQLRLARQLGLYDDLVQLLEKQKIVRPSHLTPREFSESLSYLPYEQFQTIRRLTDIFYHIRYGRRELTGPRQRLLGNVIARLQQFFTQSTANTLSIVDV